MIIVVDPRVVSLVSTVYNAPSMMTTRPDAAYAVSFGARRARAPASSNTPMSVANHAAYPHDANHSVQISADPPNLANPANPSVSVSQTVMSQTRTVTIRCLLEAMMFPCFGLLSFPSDDSLLRDNV